MATAKKAATKKMTKAKGTTSRGNTYIITESGKKHLADVSGQGAIIRDCLKGSKNGLTASEVVERVGKALKTETPAKNVAFYLCVWRADGFVKFGPARKA